MASMIRPRNPGGNEGILTGVGTRAYIHHPAEHMFDS